MAKEGHKKGHGSGLDRRELQHRGVLGGAVRGQKDYIKNEGHLVPPHLVLNANDEIEIYLEKDII